MKKAYISLERGEKERDGDDGEEKDSDHADYGWTQQTGKSLGDGRMDEYLGGEEDGGEGEKEETPYTPHSPQQWRSSESLGNMWTRRWRSVSRDIALGARVPLVYNAEFVPPQFNRPVRGHQEDFSKNGIWMKTFVNLKKSFLISLPTPRSAAFAQL